MNYLDKLNKNVDVLSSIAGIVLGTIILCVGTITNRSETFEIGVVILVGSLLYLATRRQRSKVNISDHSSRSFSLGLDIFFIVTIVTSMLIFHYSVYRPPIYYIIISLASASLVPDILISQGKRYVVILVKILLLALIIRGCLFYEYPGFYGTDTWIHASVIDYFAQIGDISYNIPTIEINNSYSNMPVMHILILFVKGITDLDTKSAFFLSIGLFNIISLIFIFFVGKRLVDTKFGLLAALIIGINQFHIVAGVFLIPNSFSIVLFIIIIYLLIKKRGPHTIDLGLTIALSVILIFTHSVGAFVMAITLFIFLFVNMLYKKITKNSFEETSIDSKLAMLFFTVMISHWMFMFYSDEHSRFTSLLSPFVSALKTNVEFVGLTSPAADSIENRIGFLIFMFFIVIGSLYWISSKNRNNVRTILLFGTLLLSIIIFVTPVFNIRNIAPGRWIVFIATIGAVIGAQGLIVFSSFFKGQVTRTIIVTAVLMFVYAFFNLNNAAINPQSPFIDHESRYQHTQSESVAADTVWDLYERKIITDEPFTNQYILNKGGVSHVGGYVFLLPWYKEGDWPEELLYGVDARYIPKYGDDNVILLRNYIYLHPELMDLALHGYMKEYGNHDYEYSFEAFLGEFEGQEYDRVYSNPQANAYLHRVGIQ